MNEELSADPVELLKTYRDLAAGVRMIRRAVDRAVRAGVLPSAGRPGITPLQECEAIARTIYAAAVKRSKESGAGTLAGLSTNDGSYR